MNKGTHSICQPCRDRKNPNREVGKADRNPRRFLIVGKADRELCCFCGETHQSGIYVSEDSETLLCKGDHK